MTDQFMVEMHEFDLNFAPVPDGLIFSELSDAAVRVFAAILRIGKNKEARGTFTELGARLGKRQASRRGEAKGGKGMSPAKVKRAVKELEAAGWLSVTRQRDPKGHWLPHRYRPHAVANLVDNRPVIDEPSTPPVIDDRSNGVIDDRSNGVIDDPGNKERVDRKPKERGDQLSLTAADDPPVDPNAAAEDLATMFVTAVNGTPGDYPPARWAKDWVAQLALILTAAAKEADRGGTVTASDVAELGDVIEFVTSSDYWAKVAGRPAKLRAVLARRGPELRADMDQARRAPEPKPSVQASPFPMAPSPSDVWRLVTLAHSDGRRWGTPWLDMLAERTDDPAVLAAARETAPAIRSQSEGDARVAFFAALKGHRAQVAS